MVMVASPSSREHPTLTKTVDVITSMDAALSFTANDKARMPTNAETVYDQFESYDFDGNVDYQRGIQSILKNTAGKSQQDVDVSIGKAKWFYFNK